MGDLRFCLARRVISALPLRATRLAGRIRVVAAAALVVCVSLSGGDARADCAPDPATEGDTVTCTGIDTDGFATESDSITISVEADAEVSGKGGDYGTILMGSFEQPVDGTIIVNDGIIRPAYFDEFSFSAIPAINIIGTNSSVTNNGLIDAIFPVDPETLGAAGWGIRITKPIVSTGPTTETVINSGSIRGVTGIEIVDRDSANSASSAVNLTNSGDIEGTYWGVNIESASNVTVISDPFSSVEATHFAGISINGHVSTGITGIAKIIQRASSVISSGGDGIYISNAGVADIELQSGTVDAPTLIRSGSWGINARAGDLTVTLRSNSHLEPLGESSGGGILIDSGARASVLVEAGSSITTGGGHAIRVEDPGDLMLINDGLLAPGLHGYGIILRTRSVSEFNVVNNGTIAVQSGTGFQVCCNSGNTVFKNYGSITGTGDYGSGITFWGAGEVLNEGTISMNGGGGSGVATFWFDQPPVAVTNHGLIQTLGGGLVLEEMAFRHELDEDGNLIQVPLPTGFFTNVQYGVLVSNGSILNDIDGIIEAPGELSTAVRMTWEEGQNVVLENYGTITGTAGSVARFDGRGPDGNIIRNDRFIFGAIDGGPGQDIVVNYGTITGSIGLGDGDDSFTNKSTGIINGSIDLGAGFDSLTNETGGLISAMDDAVVAGDDSTIVNAGTITSTYDANPADTRTLAAAVTVGNDSDIQNSGTISVESGLAIPFVSGVQVGNRNNVRNDGTISVVQSAAPPEEGWAVGVFAAGAANVTENNGQIDVSGPSRSVGIFSHSGGEVTNNGDISAVTENNVAIGIIGWEGHNIVNNGTVSADAGGGGAVAILTVGGASIVNSGTLTASNDGEDSEGIHVGGGSSSELVSIANTGSITAKTAIGSARGIPSGASSNVILENTGIITGDILFEGGDNTITNKSTGVINGTIDLGDGTNTLTNEAGGLISSEGNTVMGAEFTAIDNAGTISSTGSGWAIRVGENSTINNTGTISIATETATLFTSGVSLGGSTTVRNEGTITVEKILDPADDDLMSGVGINAFEGGGNFLENNGRIEVGGTASAFGIYSLVGDEVINNGEIDVVSENRFAAGIVGIISDNTIINNGAISASTAGSSAGIATLGGATIVNNGTIEVAGGAGIARGVFVLSGWPHPVSIRNTGSITAETAIESIKGVSSGVAANVALENTGTITGDILFEGGSNTVEFGTGSDVTGDLLGGDGIDVLTLSGSGTFAGAFNGFEELIVTGGSSAFNTAGASAVPVTTVNGGRLNLNGTLTTDATVNAGGVLGGGGTIVGIVTNNGTVSPGNSIGTLAIDGDYRQGADGVLSVEIGAGGSDLLAISGTAGLNGTIETSIALNDFAALDRTSVAVLTAGTIEGQFDNEGTTRQGFWDVTVTSGPSDVRVSIGNIDVPLGATSPSVGALGGALASIMGVSGPASAQITELSSSSVQSQQITGQASANLATATIGNTANFNSAILGRLEDARFAEAASSDTASFTEARSGAPSWVGWVGYSFVSHFDREALERGARDNVLKFSGGADIALSPRARVGYALGLFSSELDASRFAGDNQVEGIQASAYGAYRRGKAFVNTVLGVANNRFELERKIDFGFVKERLSGETDGTDVNALVEAGYDLSYRGVRVIPFASLQGVSSHREAYREDGGVFALNVAADTAYSLQSALGVKLGGNWTTDAGLKMSSRLKLAWAHEYLDHRRDVRVAFARLPEREFFLIGRGINRDALEVETEMGLRLTGQLNAVVKYRGLIGSRDTAHGITAGFNLAL